MDSLAALGHLRPKHPKELSDSDRKLMGAAKDFESVMVEQVLTAMRATVPDDPLTGSAERMMSGMQDQEMAKSMSSHGGGFGLAEVLFEQLRVRPHGPGAAAGNQPPQVPSEGADRGGNRDHIPTHGSRGTGQ